MARELSVVVTDELAEEVEEACQERGFNSVEEFVESALRDSVNAEDPYTEEARRKMEEVRRLYEEEGGDDINDLFRQVGIDDI